MRLIVFILCTCLFSYDSFDLLSKGGEKTVDKNCFNPSWGFDSYTFTIEMLNDSYNAKATTLYIGEINDDYNISFHEALTDESFSKKKKRKSSRYYQRAISWLNVDSEEQLLLGITKNYEIKKIKLGKYPDFYIEEGEPLLEKPPIWLRGEPAYFTTSSDRFYFVSRVLDNEIIYTNEVDDEGQPDYLEQLGLKKFNLEIPIKSISITPDNSQLLVVTYNESLSEIYNFSLNWDEYTMSISDPTIIKKPDENLVYFDCMRDPYNDQRYILVGSNKELDENSTAYAFIINNNEVEGKFLFYRHKEESANYIEPVIQFYPRSEKIYFLKRADGNTKVLSYWDGEEIVETKMDLTNIRDFKISPDGEKFMVVTFNPQDLYLYSLKK
jgi:hypothetical protein